MKYSNENDYMQCMWELWMSWNPTSTLTKKHLLTLCNNIIERTLQSWTLRDDSTLGTIVSSMDIISQPDRRKQCSDQCIYWAEVKDYGQTQGIKPTENDPELKRNNFEEYVGKRVVTQNKLQVAIGPKSTPQPPPRARTSQLHKDRHPISGMKNWTVPGPGTSPAYEKAISSWDPACSFMAPVVDIQITKKVKLEDIFALCSQEDLANHDCLAAQIRSC